MQTEQFQGIKFLFSEPMWRIISSYNVCSMNEWVSVKHWIITQNLAFHTLILDENKNHLSQNKSFCVLFFVNEKRKVRRWKIFREEKKNKQKSGTVKRRIHPRDKNFCSVYFYGIFSEYQSSQVWQQKMFYLFEKDGSEFAVLWGFFLCCHELNFSLYVHNVACTGKMFFDEFFMRYF